MIKTVVEDGEPGLQLNPLGGGALGLVKNYRRFPT